MKLDFRQLISCHQYPICLDMRFLVFFILSICPYVTDASELFPGCLAERADSLRAQALQMEKTLAVASTENIKSFCKLTIQSRLNSEEFPNLRLDPMQSDWGVQAFNYSPKGNMTPWEFTIFPNAGSRAFGMKCALSLVTQAIRSDCSSSLSIDVSIERLKNSLQEPAESTSFWPGKLKFKDLNSLPGYGSSILKSFSIAHRFLCSQVNPLDTEACSKGVAKIVKDSAPAKYEYDTSIQPITFAPLIKKELEDDNIREGLKKAAFLLLNRTQTSDVDHANLFSDLKSSFTSTGLSEKASEEATWDTLGVISTGGANLSTRLLNFQLNPKEASSARALSAIAAAIPFLDSKSDVSDHLYSYPEKVQSTCDTGKSYSFWMSAYLTREGIKSGLSKEAAAEAAFAANYGYRLTIDDIAKDLHSQNNYSPLANLLRIDFAVTAAGTAFAAGDSKKTSSTISIDNTIRKSIADSTPVGPSSEIGASVMSSLPLPFSFWKLNSNISPQSIFKTLNN